jgi:hypothetical protein
MSDGVLKELLVAILTKFDESSNKQALDAVDKSQATITEREKKGQAERAKNLTASLAVASRNVTAFTKTIIQAGEKVSLGLVTIAGAVEGAAVAGTFALAKLSKEMSQAYYSGQKLGSAVKDMDAFRYASEQAGSSAAKAQAGLEELGNLRNTNPAAYVGLLQRLGVAARDAAGNLRAPAQAAMDLGPALAKLPRQMQLLFGNQLGMDNDQTLAMTRPAFLAQLEQYKQMQSKIGFDPDKAAADGAKFQQIWTKMWSAVDIVSKKVQSAFFNQVGGSVDHVTDWLVKNSGRISDLAIKVGDYALHLATSIVDLTANFDKLSPTTQRFVEILAGVAAGFLALQAGPIGAIMALAAALTFLWDDYEKYKQGLPSIVDWEKWEPKIKAAIEGLDNLWHKFDDLSVKITGQGGLQVAMEAFAVFMATTWVTKLVGAFATVSKAWAPLAALLTAAGYLANNTGSNVDPWADQTTGETALRAADPGIADRVYGKRGEQLPHGPHHGPGTHAQPHDTRNLWQRTMPKALGGKDAPTAGNADAPYVPTGPVPGASGYGTTNAYWKGPLDGKGEGGYLGPREMFDYLKKNGATDNEALMLTGAASSESSFNPNAKHDPKNGVFTGHGLFGHNDGRLDMRGRNWQEQSLMALNELRNRSIKGVGNLGNALARAKTPEEITDVQMHYEAPRGYQTKNPRAGDNYTGRLNSIRRFSAMAGKAPSVSPPPASISAPIGDQAALDAQRRIVEGKARAGDAAMLSEYRRQQNTPTPKRDTSWHQSPLQATQGGGRNSLTDLYDAGWAKHAEGALTLRNPPGVSAASMYHAYDNSKTTTVSPTVNQSVTINGVQDPHAIGKHLQHHAKRGVQDTLRNMQGPST